MLSWMKHKLEPSLLGEISTNSDMQMKPLMAGKRRGTKEPLNEKRRVEKLAQNSIFKNEDYGIWSHHLMAN